MSFDRCTPGSVVGDIVGAEALKDPALSQEVIASLGDEGLTSFIARNASDTMESVRDTPLTPMKATLDKQLSYWENMQGQLKQSYKGPDGGVIQKSTLASIFHESMTPSSILGASFIDEVDELSMQLFRDGIVDGAKYKKALDGFFSEVDVSQFNDSQRIYYEKYKADRYSGLMMRRSKNQLVGKVDALSKGAVIANPTVLIGNFVEPLMKGVPLYGKNFFKGLKNLISERGAAGLFEEIPELRGQGLYGLDIGDVAPDRGIIERFAGVMDRPSKNLMYYVGQAAEGSEIGGRRAIQNVLFLPTFANTPLVYRTPESRAAVRLLSYSIGTMQLGHDVAKAAITQQTPEAISRLAGLLGMYGIITGVPAYMESQGEDVANIPLVGPLWKVAAGVSGVNMIDRINIPGSIFSGVVLKPITKMAKAFEDPDELDAVDLWNFGASIAYMSAVPGSSLENLIGNNQFRKGVKSSLELITGEKEAGEAFTQAFVPGFRE